MTAPRAFDWSEAEVQQKRLCTKLGVAWCTASSTVIAGVAKNLGSGEMPLNGLRHPAGPGTSGWFLWAGQSFSQAHDFFMPTCIQHLADSCPTVIPYLGLPPGSRFLIAPGHEDVWEDKTLLNI